MGIPANETRKPKPISETRRIRKPIMEKKRRDRINSCLQVLANLLLESRLIRKSPNKETKLEKADILELTVKHWDKLTKNCSVSVSNEQIQEQIRSEPEGNEEETVFVEQTRKTSEYGVTHPQPNQTNTKESCFVSGYKECMRLVDQSLNTEISDMLRKDLLSHLMVNVDMLNPEGQHTYDSMPTHCQDNIIDDCDATSTGHDVVNGEESCVKLIPTRLRGGVFALVMESDLPHIQGDVSGFHELDPSHVTKEEAGDYKVHYVHTPSAACKLAENSCDEYLQQTLQEEELIDIETVEPSRMGVEEYGDEMWRPW